MPTYDYRCRSCGNVTEVIHSMIEDGPSACEICGGQLRRVMFPSGIIFKGSGFYRNDSRASSSSSSSSDSGSDTPTAAKPDAKPDATSATTKTEKSDASGVTKPAASD